MNIINSNKKNSNTICHFTLSLSALSPNKPFNSYKKANAYKYHLIPSSFLLFCSGPVSL